MLNNPCKQLFKLTNSPADIGNKAKIAVLMQFPVPTFAVIEQICKVGMRIASLIEKIRFSITFKVQCLLIVLNSHVMETDH